MIEIIQRGSFYLTEPNSAQSHSDERMLHETVKKAVASIGLDTHSTVSCGKATPVRVKVSNPATRSMNSGLGMSDPRASIACLAAYFDSATFTTV